MSTKKEEIIIQCASKLFLEKGFDKITVRDIAREANVNVAMINYYFRSKDNLVALVIESMITKYYERLHPLLNSEMNLQKKIEVFVNQFIDMLAEEPGLTLFLLSVLRDAPDIIYQTPLVQFLFDTPVFFKQLEEEADKGTIKKVNADQFYICVLSLILFPFSIIEIISKRKEYTEKGITRNLHSRKDIIVKMLLSYLNN